MTVVTEYFEEVATTAEVEAVLVGSAGKYWRLERFCTYPSRQLQHTLYLHYLTQTTLYLQPSLMVCMVGVDSDSLQVDSQPKLFELV